jgi:ketosteroid isomerase-like protein
VEVVEKLQTGDLALTHARVHVVAGDGSDRLELSGRGTVVSRREPDGSLLIVVDNPISPE